MKSIAIGALSLVIEVWCGISRTCSRKSTFTPRSRTGMSRTSPGPLSRFFPVERPSRKTTSRSYSCTIRTALARKNRPSRPTPPTKQATGITLSMSFSSLLSERRFYFLYEQDQTFKGHHSNGTSSRDGRPGPGGPQFPTHVDRAHVFGGDLAAHLPDLPHHFSRIDAGAVGLGSHGRG